jgi:hypothetical protein
LAILLLKGKPRPVAPGGGDLPEERWLPINFTPFLKNPQEK